MRISPAIVGPPVSGSQGISLVYYDVRDYGALLNGVADDSGSIQAAIDAASAAGGGIVVIPGRAFVAGVVINTTLELQTGVWLRGLGASTSLIGSADPMIQIKQDVVHDRMAITDLFLQDPDGVGIKLQTNGALQLGWPRITVENVTVADAAGDAFYVVNSLVIECRFINCVSLRAGGRGFFNDATDNMFVACTAADSGQDGFDIRGGNNKFVCCKSYANTQDGFRLAGAGRHSLAGCESQDNGRYGYSLEGSFNTLAGCLADTDNLAGVAISGAQNSVNGSFMTGGGGSGQTTKTGVFFSVDTTNNLVSGVTNCTPPVAGKAEGNSVQIKTCVDSRTEVTFTSPWTPNPYDGEIQAMTLTGDLTLVNPVYKHVGQRLTLELRQDGSGAHSVTFPDHFRTSWTPSTTANVLNVISFEYDGDSWQQTSSVTGLTPKPAGPSDTFNRANEVLNVSSSGDTWTKVNSGAGVWNVVSNQAKTIGSSNFQTNIAVLDAGDPDFTVQVTIVTDAVGAQIVWRYSDSSNYFAAGGNTLYKRVAGSPVTIVGGVFNIASGDVVVVVTSGPNHFFYVNGTLAYSFPDAFNLSATKSGMLASGDADIFDAFAIT